MTKSVDFTNPPVVEVVCGAAFQRLAAFKAPHIGAFWMTLPERFRRVEETSPIAYPDDPRVFELAEVPPHPRTWFLTEDDRELVQLQQNRFLYNWKKPAENTDDTYPEFKNIFPLFKEYLALFRDFVSEKQLGELEFHQYELTYLNHIPASTVISKLNRFSDVLIDHVSDASRERFLPEPTGFNWISIYELPDGKGRLHVSAQSATKKADTREKLLRLELTARGTTQSTSDDAMEAWFEVAHDWIVEGFADITDQVVQHEIWGRKR